ncbi:hypothetical protein TWF481_001834 [Arthrobotrys musiformis]|uniref:DUF4470 domain-containing protein n=1 Tax=Arthrobotrys musiformis TaxID=47236 RepID=A0AAV9VUG1_9PEZI
MFHRSYFDPFRPFYPIGNSKAINLAEYLPPEIDVDALLLGCGDVRNILFRLFSEFDSGYTASATRKYSFTCCDIDPGIIARNILILAMIMNKEDVKSIWSIYYDFLIPDKCSVSLKKYVEQLLCSADTIESWSNSDIGKILKI